MRIRFFCLLLLLVFLADVTKASCIRGCKCKQDSSIESITTIIQDCDNPLVITKELLKNISKESSVLSFKNVEIEKFDKESLRELQKLETIHVEDSNIGVIHENAFDYVELQTMAFERTTFDESPVLKAEYIIELVFRDCSLLEVPNLDYLPALEYVNVENNFITTINENIFHNTIHLEEVSFAHNQIRYLPPNLFVNTTDFNTLNLAYNPLTKFELDYPSSLETLTLSYCNLTTFDRRVTENLAIVNNLTLNGNSLSSLPLDVFEPMTELNIIDLSNNKIVELDDNIFFENNKLDQITLDNNPFESLPKFQSKAKSFEVTSFSCRNCGLKTVSGVFTNMNTLKKLDLSNNKLKKIDGDLTKLRMLLLSGNEIASIGINSLGKNPTIEVLDLSKNPLMPLDPVVFTAMPALKTLNASSSNLRSLWANHNAILPHLEQLIIDHNQLTTLTVDDMKITPNLIMIKLDDNPIPTTQDWKEVFKYLIKNGVSMNDNFIKTHEELTDDIWSVTSDGEDDDDDDMEVDDNTDDDDDDDYDPEDETEDDGVEASVLSTGGFNLAKASYILSITSVFILTALLVLFVAVVLTLLILRRNNSFNIHNSNLPRLKIPLWHTQPGQKKHSGSVYKPLSEDLSGPRTPIINRYEFKQTPQIHNSLP